MVIPSGAIQAFERVSGERHALTIGNFDGVHRGHRHLLDRVKAAAREHGARSLVVTFEPHPVAVLRPDVAPPRIARPEEKVPLLHAAGIDEVVIVPFDRDFASLSPEAFLETVVQSAHPVAILVGQGFRFGRMRAGDIETMRAYGAEHGFTACEVEPLSDEHGVISSSRIRAALAAGDIDIATNLLGRRFRLTGLVEHGTARGRELGYPTANLTIPEGQCVPADGIYTGYAHLDDSVNGSHEALIYIGSSPTFGDGRRLVEVNILDYRGDLYSTELEIEFLAKIRGDKAFESAEALVEQMAIDEEQSRALLARSTPEHMVRGN